MEFSKISIKSKMNYLFDWDKDSQSLRLVISNVEPKGYEKEPRIFKEVHTKLISFEIANRAAQRYIEFFEKQWDYYNV